MIVLTIMGHLLINIKKAMTISGEPFALCVRIDPVSVCITTHASKTIPSIVMQVLTPMWVPHEESIIHRQ